MVEDSQSKTFVVQHSGLADFKSITEALQACVDGDNIKIQIGQYDEKVVLDKSVNLIGEAESSTDVLVSGGVVCTAGGSLQNLSVQGSVDVRSGNVMISQCEISLGPDGVRVQRGANPTILKNVIHGAQSGGDGIYFAEGSQGTAEGNNIYGNRMNGIHVNAAEVTLKQNTIHDCPYGIFFRRGGRGTVELNDIATIVNFGIYIIGGSDPTVSANTVSACGVHCVLIAQEGKGIIKENTLNGNFNVKRLCGPTIGSNFCSGTFENENPTT